MKIWLSKQVDIDIFSDFQFGKHIVVSFFGRRVAHFVIEEGSTEIKRLKR